MKISHEVPKCLLNNSREFNDYDYALPHLLDESEVYEKFFRKSKEEGRYIIMDNSLHELGEAYDHKRLLHWIQELEPDEFIVPDVWMKSSQTAAQAKYWLQFKYPKKTKITAVVQGEDEHSARLCANLLKDLGYKKLNISYGATWYGDTAIEKALGRINFVKSLLNDKQFKDIKFHLLGCAVPQEFGWYENHPQIESIDTSNPVMAALEGITYSNGGLFEKPTANMNEYFDISPYKVNYEDVLKNVKRFRKINGFAYIQNIPGTNLNSIKHG
jgi:hypothetical protein